MNAEIKLKFGKHKGAMLKDVPEEYLKWAVDGKILKGRAMLYAKQKLNYPKDKFRVTVEDSVSGDGIYIVEAYNKNQAIKVAQKENKIQNTQSFCGTSYSVAKL